MKKRSVRRSPNCAESTIFAPLSRGATETACTMPGWPRHDSFRIELFSGYDMNGSASISF
ncbi:hypothetical protein [Burkholderia sp. 4M9327F10]|jgi:hypothetical protein|uniref:hypothetical protein n=1 Tax=Paraburkholderia sp. TaxID=1926495 RepID=UPI0010F65FAC